MRPHIDGLTWAAIGFLGFVAVVTAVSHDYTGSSTAVFLAFVLLVLALRHGEE